MDLSFWEKQTFFGDIDLLVVGSGIVGLNTARAMKQLRPNWKIVVIDRGFLPYGASTKNAGFACFGSVSELLNDFSKMAENDVFDLIQRRWDGLSRLREVLGDDQIDYEPFGGFEMFTYEDEKLYKQCNEKIEFLNEALFRITGHKLVYKNADSKINNFNFKNVNHLIENTQEGQIDTGKMMHRLLAYVRSVGIDVYNGIEIENWERNLFGFEIRTKQGFSFNSKRIFAATNGFARELLPTLVVEPGRAQVLITTPIDNLKVKGSFHYDQGYYYFRNVGSRLLFGGGRNLDFESERTTKFGLTSLVQTKLEEILSTVILPDKNYQIESRWSGIMGLGPVKTTIIKKVEAGIYCAVRMGGMGIAIGTLVGEEAATLIANDN